MPTLEYSGQFSLGSDDSVFLDYLNNFGVDAFLQADKNIKDDSITHPHVILYRDLTNDGVPEIVVSSTRLFIFGCQDGKYQTLLATQQSAWGTQQQIVAINDLNQNGIPELMILIETGTQDNSSYQLFEWGGGKFNSLISSKEPVTGEAMDTLSLWSGGKIGFQDVDEDGMKEIVVQIGSPLVADYDYTAPWRKMTEIYKWNGHQFFRSQRTFDPPQYRFQAVEDADYAVLAGAYDQALDLYRQVIFNDKLDWWTNERKEYIIDRIVAAYGSHPFIVTPPAPDPHEYLYLSGYARFRMMVLLLMRGDITDAQVVYQALITKYPESTPGSIYAQMAQVFWQDYQINHSIGIACEKSQSVASKNSQEATRYFLDDYVHDGVKEKYTVEQLCPFK